MLNGLTLTSAATAPIACNKSTEVNIVAASGTTNTLTDSAKNNDDNYPDNEDAENAVLKCKDGSQVTLSGSGRLILNANGKNGIKSGATTDEEGTASLTIRNVSLTISAPVNDAINAYTSSGDGFDSNGTLNISGGSINVWSSNTADNQPLDADGTITISGGSSGMGMSLSASQAYVTFGGSAMGGGNMGGQPGGRASGTSGGSSASVKKGSTISIQNGSASMFSTTALCNASYIFFSSPSLTSGTSYTLCSGSTSVAAATAQTGSSQSGGMGGGMQLGNNQQPGASQPQPGQTANPPQSPNAVTGTSSDSADTSADTGSAGSAASSASGNRFSDVSSGSWYYDAVQYVYNAGLMSGTGSSAFSPDGATTRGMIVAILYRLEGSPVCGSASFSYRYSIKNFHSWNGSF